MLDARLMSTEFDENSSNRSYHKNYIKNLFEHFSSKLLDPQATKINIW